jgi:hypothetical protein
MPVTCSFCSEKGHSIRKCLSNQKNVLYDSMVQTAEICMRNNFDFIQQSFAFYNYLNNLKISELKMLIIIINNLNNIRAKIPSRNRKYQICSTILYSYFTDFIFNILNIQIQNDRALWILRVCMKYWLQLCNGVIYEVSYATFETFMMNLQNDHIREKPELKFPIQIELTSSVSNTTTFECSICMNNVCSQIDQIITNCNHAFCKTCVEQVFNYSIINKNHPSCALCRSNYSKITVNTIQVFQQFKKFIE